MSSGAVVLDYGHREEKRREGKSLALLAPERMREALATEERIREFCDRLMEGVKVRDRTCMSLYPAILKAIDAQVDLLAVFVGRFGGRVQSESHAEVLISRAVEAEDADDDETYEKALEFAQDYRKRHGLPALVEAA